MAHANMTAFDDDSEAARYNRPLSILAMVALCQPGGITLSTTPLLLASFLQSGRFTQAQAASLGSAELAGMAIGLIISALVMTRVDRRWYAVAAIALIVAGHSASIQTGLQGNYALTLAARCLAGLGEGGVTGVGVASLAGLLAPDRGFGFAVTGNLVGGAIMFALMPALEATGGFRLILSVIAGYSALFGLAIPLLPRREPRKPAEATDGRGDSASLAPALLGLGGMLMFLGGIGAVWPITPQIGAARGVPSGEIATALSLAGLAGAATGLLVGWLGARLGRLFPILLGGAGVVCAMIALLLDFGGHGFVLNAILFMVFWIFSIPYLLGALAAMDGSGRLAAMSMAMQTFGLAAGQALTAWLIAKTAGFDGSIYIGAGLIVAAMLLMWIALRSAQQRAMVVSPA